MSTATLGRSFGEFFEDRSRVGFAAAVGAALAERGVAALGGLGGRDDVLALAAELMEVWPHRDGDPDGLTMIRDTGSRHSGRAGFAGLGRGEVLPHTERSPLPDPPRVMLLVCARPGDSGGENLLVDGRAVLADLAGHHPAALEALSAPRAALFGGSDGHFAPVLALLPTGRWRIRLRQDDLARFSPQAQAHLPVLRAAIDRHALRLRLAPGQALVLDNHRVLHARSAFTGERLMIRALGAARPALRLAAGFSAPWAASGPASEPSTAPP
ncbi:TauD/TfdA family dioxygenase [Kitasatospora griseola]|uniref:TauD/TfdA family dioxygenase n=1 Tax=Kitasatospora griseola TaxID=2064 RepID=UPI0038013C86